MSDPKPYVGLFHWRHSDLTWKECLDPGDIPTLSEVYEWAPRGPKNVTINGTEYRVETIFPGYLYAPEANALVNFRFDPGTKRIRLNWSFSYGFISKGVSYEAVDEALLPENCSKLDQEALYFMICDKGGLSVIAVVPAMRG